MTPRNNNTAWLARWDRARWQRRWRTPILPIPAHIDSHHKLVRAAGLSGSEGRRVFELGYVNLGQAERIAAIAERHPTEIWGRLWTDIGDLDNRLEHDALRLKRFALTYTPVDNLGMN